MPSFCRLMTDKQLIRYLRTLARDECANYKDGFCLETDKRCHVISNKFESVYDGAINCDYFYECVLPANRELNNLVAYALCHDEVKSDQELSHNVKCCPMCGKIFTFNNNRQKYCRACAARAEKKGNAHRQAKHRAKR